MSMKNLTVEAVREQAARWIVLLREGGLSDTEREDFERWLASDERHEREFRAHAVVEALASDLPADIAGADIEADAHGNVIPLTPQPAAASAAGARARTRRRLWGAGIAAAVALTVGVGAWLGLRTTTPAAQTHITGIGETQTVTFADGSVAQLNTRTRLQWAGDSRERKVILREGEAVFHVAPDPARPFSVVVDNSEISVLGTEFNVYRKSSGDVVLTVAEGSVRVAQRGRDGAAPAWSATLTANQQVAYSSMGLTQPVRKLDAAKVMRWREGVIEIFDEPLPNVLGELMRYTDQRILIRDPRLAQLRLGGALSTRDVRAALGRLEKLAPIAVTESGNGFTLDYREENR